MGTLDLRRSHPTPLTRAPNRHHHRNHASHTTQVRDSDAAKPLEMRVAIRQIVAVSIGSEALEESGALKRSRSAGESDRTRNRLSTFASLIRTRPTAITT